MSEPWVSVVAMPTTIFHTATTLNGFLADDADSLDWLFAVPGADEAEQSMTGFMSTLGAFVMGATTYEWVLHHEERERPGMWAESYGALPCFVVTHRSLPTPVGGNVRFVRGAVGEWWTDVEAAAGDRVVWLVGGGDLVGQVDDAGHLDEVRLSVAPAFLASGKPLLPRRIGPDRLHLASVEQAGQFAELRYLVSR
jgi:dihydrofolate reductase